MATANHSSVSNADALALVALPRLMEVTRGRRELSVAVIDGPVDTGHADLAGARLKNLASSPYTDHPSCRHGTAVAGILVAQRESAAPGICPDVTLVVRPIFGLAPDNLAGSATPEALAAAIDDAIDAQARVINLSLALAPRGNDGRPTLHRALDRAADRGIIVVAAAGDHSTMGSSAITGHRSVIPVVSYHPRGYAEPTSNLALSIGRNGVGATGRGIVSLAPAGGARPFEGSSAAAALVTGAVALLWSEFPHAAAPAIRHAVVRSTSRRASVVPPLLNAWRAYEILRATHRQGSLR